MQHLFTTIDRCCFPWMCMLCTRSCGQAYTVTGERAGCFQTRKRWKLCLGCFNSCATGTFYRGTQGSSLTGLESIVGQIKKRLVLPEVRNWHGKGSCCGKLTRCCQKASWQCFERRHWLPLNATSLHHD